MLPGLPKRRLTQICYIWGMRENFKNPWAINQSQSNRTLWQSAHITGRQAHIRYAFSEARSKLESQLTLLIALSYLIWKTMGIEEESFYNILFLPQFWGSAFASLFSLQLAQCFLWLSTYNYFSIKALILCVLYTAP